MALKPCIVCAEPSPEARCAVHRAPGTSPRARGYDAAHDKRAAELKRQSMRTRAPCVLCGLPIDYGARPPLAASFAAHHTTRDKSAVGEIFPAHRACNAAAGRPAR